MFIHKATFSIGITNSGTMLFSPACYDAEGLRCRLCARGKNATEDPTGQHDTEPGSWVST